MRRPSLAVIAASLFALPALAQGEPLHPGSTPGLGEALGFRSDIGPVGGSLGRTSSAQAEKAALTEATPGQTVRDASGHVVGKVVRVARDGRGGPREVLVRGFGGKMSRVHVESFDAEGDAWLGGAKDLQDPRMLWY